VEFEGTKCWLKSFDSNKVIVKAIKKGRLYKLVGLVFLGLCTQTYVVPWQHFMVGKNIF
jgi:hypothetical protein